MTKENNVMENHLFQQNVIRLALRGMEEEEIACITDEINIEHANDNRI